MGRTRSISSTDTEIQKIEAKQVMDAFKRSGKSMREPMAFMEG